MQTADVKTVTLLELFFFGKISSKGPQIKAPISLSER